MVRQMGPAIVNLVLFKTADRTPTGWMPAGGRHVLRIFYWKDRIFCHQPSMLIIDAKKCLFNKIFDSKKFCLFYKSLVQQDRVVKKMDYFPIQPCSIPSYLQGPSHPVLSAGPVLSFPTCREHIHYFSNRGHSCVISLEDEPESLISSNNGSGVKKIFSTPCWSTATSSLVTCDGTMAAQIEAVFAGDDPKFSACFSFKNIVDEPLR